ncbi:MAG: hypothetical protein VKN83_07380 [Cyanobacteriota bacterium]|nr:hypothetical protein [Cyanobacteriota bacterium]
MSASVTEPGGGALSLPSVLLLVLVSWSLLGCAEEPLPKVKPNREDCLRGFEMGKLKDAIARCDEVVAAYPTDPFPLNERFLLHTLNQDSPAACRDILRAQALAQKAKPGTVDELLRQDLKLRLASCQPPPKAPQQRSSH